MRWNSAAVGASITLALCASGAARARAEWAVPVGGPGFDRVAGIAFDAEGNAAVVGTFQGSAALSTLALSADGPRPLLVARLDPAGGVIWGRAVAGQFTEAVVAAQPDGEIVVAGAFDGQIDFGDEPLVGTSFEYFLARFRPDGVLVGSLSGGGDGQTTVDGAGVGPEGVVSIVGAFNNSVDLGAGSVTSSSTDLYVTRYRPDGSGLSVSSYGGPPEDHSLAAAVDGDGRVVVTGFFGLRDTNLGGEALPASAGSDAFAASYDAAGGHLWSTGFATAGNESGLGVAPTSDGGAVVVGSFDAELILGDVLHVPRGSSDGFLVRLAADGSVLWSLALSGEGVDLLNAVAIDSEGRVFGAGSFEGGAVLDDRQLAGSGGPDIVLFRASPDGVVESALVLGGPGIDSSSALAIGPDGTLLLAGGFEEELQLPQGALSSVGEVDAFLARFDPDFAG